MSRCGRGRWNRASLLWLEGLEVRQPRAVLAASMGDAAESPLVEGSHPLPRCEAVERAADGAARNAAACEGVAMPVDSIGMLSVAVGHNGLAGGAQAHSLDAIAAGLMHAGHSALIGGVPRIRFGADHGDADDEERPSFGTVGLHVPLALASEHAADGSRDASFQQIAPRHNGGHAPAPTLGLWSDHGLLLPPAVMPGVADDRPSGHGAEVGADELAAEHWAGESAATHDAAMGALHDRDDWEVNTWSDHWEMIRTGATPSAERDGTLSAAAPATRNSADSVAVVFTEFRMDSSGELMTAVRQERSKKPWLPPNDRPHVTRASAETQPVWERPTAWGLALLTGSWALYRECPLHAAAADQPLRTWTRTKVTLPG